MKFRTRVAVVASLVLTMGGIASGLGQANAAPAPRETITTSSTNGCVVLPSLQLAVCLGRF